MTLIKRKLKGLIEYMDLRNTDGIFTEKDVVGVSTSKEMIPTKANLEGVNLRSYKLFCPGWFSFVADTSRRGDKMALAYNNTKDTHIVSTWYVVFRVTNEAEEVLLPDYLFLYFNRTEFDRYARTNSWGSAREYFWFSDMEDIEIELPPIDIQKKYVSVYNAMLENQKSYERGAEYLKLVCDAYIEELRKKISCEKIGKYLCETHDKNEKGLDLKNRSVSNTKVFIDAKEAVVSGVETRKYLIVEKGDFAYNTVTTRNADKLSIALNKDERCLVSPIYTSFKVIDDRLLPDYLFLWFKRSEYDRYARFNSWGSARETYAFETLSETKIPVPAIGIQKAIVDVLLVCEERRIINDKLKAQIKDICSILIKGSIEEARNTKEE